MATEIVKTIRASGGDYTTLSAWEAALPASLVTADEQHTAVCYNDWPSGLDDTVTISGVTADVTRYIKVTVADGHRHDGTPQSGFFIKGDSGGNTVPKFAVEVLRTRIEGIDVENTRSSGHFAFYSATGTLNDIRYENCIARCNDGRAFSSSVGSNYATTRTAFYNCLAWSSSQGFARHDSVRSRYNAYNCVAANCDIGFASGSTNKAAIQNCVAYGSTTIDFENQVDATNSGYNASSDSSASVFTGGVTGVVDADFVDATGGDYHLASGSALIGVGSNLYSLFTDDIDGDIRPSSGAWDIGFDHYVASGATGTIDASESGSDTASLTGAVRVSGAISATETGADAASVSGDVHVGGSLAVSESGVDVAALSGDVRVAGSISVSEVGTDTAAITGGLVTPAITGTISAVEAGSDTASVSGDVLVRGSISVAEVGADTALLSGDIVVSGALSAGEIGADTAFINGSSAIISTGTVSAGESGSDGCAIAGKVYLSGELSAVEGGLDGFAVSGNIRVAGALSASEAGSDTASITGTAAIISTGTLVAAESGSDGCSVSAKVYIAGELSAVEGALDGFAVSGNILVSGLLTASESGADTAYIYETPILPRRPLPDVFVRSEQLRVFAHSQRLDIWVKSLSDSVRIK